MKELRQSRAFTAAVIILVVILCTANAIYGRERIAKKNAVTESGYWVWQAYDPELSEKIKDSFRETDWARYVNEAGKAQSAVFEELVNGA